MASNNSPTSSSINLIRNGSTIGNMVWIDSNTNGIQDVTELGQVLSSTPMIELRNSATDAVVKTARSTSLT
jgi:hypothetical protein